MQTTITVRGQTVVPAKLRKKYKLTPHKKIVWLDEGGVIVVMPVPDDPVKELKGMFKGDNLREKLLSIRREENEYE